MLEGVITHSRMLDLIQLVTSSGEPIFRLITLCGESPVSEDQDQSGNGFDAGWDLDQTANGYDVR